MPSLPRRPGPSDNPQEVANNDVLLTPTAELRYAPPDRRSPPFPSVPSVPFGHSGAADLRHVVLTTHADAACAIRRDDLLPGPTGATLAL